MRRETKQNLTALVLGFGILALAGLFFLRPAFVLGVDPSALASSVRGAGSYDSYGTGSSRTSCDEVADGRFRCGVLVGSTSDARRAEIVVEVGRFGCWHTTANAQTGRSLEQLDGCIWLLDY